MKLYIVSSLRRVEKFPNVLVSYFNFYRKEDKFFEYLNDLRPERLIIDSGGFSAFRKRLPEDYLTRYIEFLKSLEGIYDLAFSLDIPYNYELTLKNQRILEKENFKNFVPVFHFGYSKEQVEELISGYDYVAAGGLVPLLKKGYFSQIVNWLDTLKEVIGDRKIHLFGVGIAIQKLKNLLLNFNIESFDVEISNGCKYGYILVFDEKKKLAKWKRVAFPSKGFRFNVKLLYHVSLHNIKKWGGYYEYL